MAPSSHQGLLAILGSQWSATLLVAILAMGVNIFLGRLLGPETFGTYQVILTLAGVAGILQEGGFATLLFREGTARSFAPSGALPLPALALGHMLTVTLLLVSGLLLWSDDISIAVAVLCSGWMAWHRFVSGQMKGAGNFVGEGAWQALSRLLISVGMLLAAWWAPTHLTLIFLGWGAGALLALGLPMARGMRRRPLFAFHPAVFRATAAMVTIDLATTLYFRSDILLMRHLGVDPARLGEYAAVYRLVEGVLLLAGPVGMVSFRHLRLCWTEQRHFHKTLTLLTGVGLASALVVVALGTLYSREIIELIYGPAYLPGNPLLPWLLLMLFFALPNTILTQAALASNREWAYAAVASACALVNVALNLWLIPRHGTLGAAWSSVATEAVLAAGLIMILRRPFSTPSAREPA